MSLRYDGKLLVCCISLGVRKQYCCTSLFPCCSGYSGQQTCITYDAVNQAYIQARKRISKYSLAMLQYYNRIRGTWSASSDRLFEKIVQRIVKGAIHSQLN